jgi:hypothetical protein
MARRLFVSLLLATVSASLFCGCSTKGSAPAQSSQSTVNDQGVSGQPEDKQNVELTEFEEWFASSIKVMGQSPGAVMKEIGREPDDIDQSFGGLVWKYTRMFDSAPTGLMELTVDFNERDKSGIIAHHQDKAHPIVRRLTLVIEMTGLEAGTNDGKRVPREQYALALKDWTGSVEDCLRLAGLTSCLTKTPKYERDERQGEQQGIDHAITYDQPTKKCGRMDLLVLSPKPTIVQAMNENTGRYESKFEKVTARDLLAMTVWRVDLE